jgi:hypothetical protein
VKIPIPDRRIVSHSFFSIHTDCTIASSKCISLDPTTPRIKCEMSIHVYPGNSNRIARDEIAAVVVLKERENQSRYSDRDSDASECSCSLIESAKGVYLLGLFELATVSGRVLRKANLG